MFNMSTLLSERITEISSRGIPNFYSITARIYSLSNEELNVIPYRIEKIQIDQLFSMNYMDSVRLGLLLTPSELMSIVNNYTDLRCTLEFKYMDGKNSEIIEGVDSFTYDYIIVINSPADLIKKYNLNELVPKEASNTREYHHSITLPITFELFAEKAYNTRHIQINSLLGDVNIKNTLLLVANTLGLSNIEMVEPNNTQVYKQISIPPMKDISNVFKFIQDRYGIYSNGMTYYIDHFGVLHIYPVSDISTKSEDIIHLYVTMENSFVGMNNYHYIEDDQIYIAINSKVMSENLGEVSIENNGSSQIALRSDNYMDQNRTLDSGNNGQFRNDNLVSIALNTNNKANEDMANVKYTTSSNNIFKMASDISTNNITIAAMAWPMAKPYSLKPGSRVIYHYENEDGIDTVNGILDSISYDISIVSVYGIPRYSCQGNLIVRLQQGII